MNTTHRLANCDSIAPTPHSADGVHANERATAFGLSAGAGGHRFRDRPPPPDTRAMGSQDWVDLTAAAGLARVARRRGWCSRTEMGRRRGLYGGLVLQRGGQLTVDQDGAGFGRRGQSAGDVHHRPVHVAEAPQGAPRMPIRTSGSLGWASTSREGAVRFRHRAAGRRRRTSPRPPTS